MMKLLVRDCTIEELRSLMDEINESRNLQLGMCKVNAEISIYNSSNCSKKYIDESVLMKQLESPK